MFEKIKAAFGNRKRRQQFNKCYSFWENDGYAVFGICAGMRTEEGDCIGSACLECPYFHDVTSEDVVVPHT